MPGIILESVQTLKALNERAGVAWRAVEGGLRSQKR